MAELKNFYVRDVEAWKKTLSRKKLSDKELEVKVVEHGIVLPARPIPGKSFVYEGGVCDNDFNFVAGFTRKDPAETTGGGERLDWTCKSSYTIDRNEIIRLDEDVIFGGVLNGHFGHFMVECLCRLWYVVKNPDLKSKVLFILVRNEPQPWFEDFFKLMGIDKERIIYVRQPLQCRSVTVPAQSEYNPWGSVKYSSEFFLPYQAIKSRVKPTTTKKIYLTRTNFDANDTGKSSRHCFNENYFEDFFVARGFKVIALENLSIEEQISLITGADEIAAVLGTLTHWAMFCKPDVKFIMLNRTDMPHSFQMFINEAFNIKNYCIVDVSKNFMYARHDNGAFLLGSNKYWQEFVADYFGEQIDEDDDISYLEDALDKYVSLWCRKYQDPTKYLNIWVESLSGMCNRIIELERAASKKRPLLNYQTHIANKGWGTWNSEGMFSNPLDQKLDIQAIKIDFAGCKVYYAVYFNEKEGWSAEVAAPEQAGTVGKHKSITGVKIRLDEAGAKDFDILYRVHTFGGAWTPWAKNGEELLSGGVKLNSIQIELKPKA